MAIVVMVNCPTCGKASQEARASNDYSLECAKCKNEKATKAEREWKSGREGLTIEERLRELEHFMYHHGSHYRPITFG